MVCPFKTEPRAAARSDRNQTRTAARGSKELLNDDRQNVAGGEHEVLGAAGLNFGSAVLGVDDNVANGYVDRYAVAVFEAAGYYIILRGWGDGVSNFLFN
jgi:hypothetical protein